MRRLAVIVLLAVGVPAAAGEIRLTIEDVAAPGFSLRGMMATLTTGEPAQLALRIDSINVQGTVWRDARAECASLTLSVHAIACQRGILHLDGEPVPLAFSYDSRSRALDATLAPAAGERWHVEARLGGPAPQISIRMDGGRLARLARWLPEGLPKLTAGRVSGTAVFKDARSASGQLIVEGVAFSDSAGLRAGEGIVAAVQLDAERAAPGWRWRASGEWRAGEVFWQPVYLKGNNQQIQISGEFSDERILVEAGRATAPGIGAIELAGASWDRAASRLTAGRLTAHRLPLAQVYEQWLKPFFAGTALADLRAGGEASLALEIRAGVLHTAELELDQASFEDAARRFVLFGATGNIPWRRDAESRGEIGLQGGEMLRVPFGATRLPLVLRGESVALDQASIPVWESRLTVSDFSAARDETGWRWRFSGALAPVSVARIAQSLGWPTMHGTLSGVVQQVTYAKSTLSVGGALNFKVFDGTITARNVVLSDPLGRAPRLAADLEMRKLDLDLLTRAFSFGSMTGLVDATVAGLELVNWQPVRFDARIESSPGDYRRTISQTAVQNISALGGAGAAAAIQRSFLRFFDRFGYEKLGLSCVLRDGVCAIDGVEPAAQGSGYVIVKGGGIPALSVIGYNRSVSWPELIVRLKRIMQENVEAVIK